MLSFHLNKNYLQKTMKDNAEMQNGRWAMVGILAAIGTYTFTGQIIPGIF